MTTDAGSTVPRRQLGRRLHRLRKDARITVKAAAEELRWLMPKIWRIERGTTSTRTPDVLAMCEVYGAPGELTEALVGLARATRAQGWWHSYLDAIPEWFELYAELEASALRLRGYESHLVPGLLQAREYADEVFRICRPNRSSVKRERRVEARLARQALLARSRPAAPRVEFVVDEMVLHRGVLSAVAMVEQLRQIEAASHLPKVSIRVLQVTDGLHPAAAANGPFTIMEFPQVLPDRPPEPTLVYCEGLQGRGRPGAVLQPGALDRLSRRPED